MQVGQTAALYLSLSLKLRLLLSLSLSLVGDKERQRCKVANGGAVFVFVFVFDAAFVVVFVAVFGGGQRETKMQVGQTAALAVLLSNQRNLYDSQFTVTSFRSLAETSRFPLAFLSSPRRALRALGLLLADGAPIVGGGKTF